MVRTPCRLAHAAACRTEIMEHFWSNLRGLFWWNRGVKRSLNNDLDLITARALQAGGHRFDPGHVHQSIQRFSGGGGNALFELVHILVHTYPKKSLFGRL